jgi:hypothetical protein
LTTKGDDRVTPAAVLDREIYSEAEAARLLEVAPSALGTGPFMCRSSLTPLVPVDRNTGLIARKRTFR